MPDSSEMAELEKRWRVRVILSKQRLDLCRLNSKEIQELMVDVPAPDGSLGLRTALRAERAALAEYTRTLRTYSDLVVYGQIPDEDEGTT